MGGRGGAPMRAQGNASTPATAVIPASPQTRVQRAYDSLPKGPAGYVGLADLREQLSDLPRETVDQALRQMSRQQGIHLTPVANRKSLTPRDRAAALRIGEDENMMISIDRTS